MASSSATTVAAYLAALPADRRDAITRVRETVNANLPAGYEEGMQYGMIGWYVPLARYPQTYNGQPLGIAALASQKNHMALYLTSVYGDPSLEIWFRKAYAAAGKKLDMGKSCVRFSKLDALPLDVIAETIRKVSVESFLARYEQLRAATSAGGKSRPGSARATRAARSKPANKASLKKASVKKDSVKKASVNRISVNKAAVNKASSKKSPAKAQRKR